MISSLSKNHTPCEQIHNSGQRIETTKYNTGISSYLDPKLWNLVSNEYKAITCLVDFKAKKLVLEN